MTTLKTRLMSLALAALFLAPGAHAVVSQAAQIVG